MAVAEVIVGAPGIETPVGIVTVFEAADGDESPTEFVAITVNE